MARHLKNWPRSSERLRFEEFKIAYEKYRKIFGIDEPIPSLRTLNKKQENKIKSAIYAVNYRLEKGKCGHGAEAAAFYLYHINESHFLGNGNKRASLIGMVAYLKLNDRFIKVRWEEIYKMAARVARADSKEKKNVINKIQGIIESSLTHFEEATEEELMDSVFDYQKDMEGGFSSRVEFQKTRDKATGDWGWISSD